MTDLDSAWASAARKLRGPVPVDDSPRVRALGPEEAEAARAAWPRSTVQHSARDRRRSAVKLTPAERSAQKIYLAVEKALRRGDLAGAGRLAANGILRNLLG